MVRGIAIDRRSDTPAYKQLAGHLRDLIDSGELAPGAALPPEPELVTRAGLNRSTVRSAIRLLRAEGRVEVVRGRGTFVRRHRLVRQHLLAGLRTEHALVGALPPSPGHDLWLAVTGLAGRVEVGYDYRRVAAPPEVAALLGDSVTGAAGELPVLRRRYLFHVDDRPHQVAWSYLRWDRVAGTRAADPANEQVHRGTLAQLADLGVRVTGAAVTVRTRMPGPEEVRLLDLGDGIPVFTLRRVLSAGAEPVEVSDAVAPGDRLELAFDVTLPGT